MRTSDAALTVASSMRMLAALMVTLTLLTTVLFAHAIVASGDDSPAPAANRVGKDPAQIAVIGGR